MLVEALSVAAVVLVGTVDALPVTPGAAASPGPSKVRLALKSFGGSGCSGDKDVATGATPTAVTLVYNSFVARAPSDNPGDILKECAVTFALNFDGGWSWSILSTRYVLNTAVAKDAKAVHSSRYFFEADGKESRAQQAFAGPVFGDQRYLDRQDVINWSQCGSRQYVHVINELYAEAGQGGQPAEVSLDVQDTHVETPVHLTLGWKPC